jgi:hypothetical protein
VAPGPARTGDLQSQSQDRAARRYLDGGNAPGEQHYEPVAMSAAKHSGVRRQGCDDVLNDLVCFDRVGFVVCDVDVITAGEPGA